MQSPIDLPKKFSAEEVSSEAMFKFNLVNKADLEFVWEHDLLVLKGKFGTINDIDGSEYEAYEARFHTPAEHTVQGMRYDMEI